MVDVYKAPEAQLTKPSSSGEYGSIEIGTSGSYRFQIKEVFSEAWSLVKGAKLSFLLAGILYWVLYVFFAFVISFVLTGLGMSVPNLFTGELPEGATAGAAGVGQVLSSILIAVVTTPLWVGLQVMGIRRSDNQQVSAGDLFSKYGHSIPLFFTLVLYYVFVAIGFVLLILPGIYLSIAYLMAFPLVTEKGLGPWRALETSRKAVTKKWFKFFGLCICLGLIFIISLIPLGIGLIWSAPFVLIAYGIVYRNMFGLHSER
ncbi:MAG: DUF975 family protein [Acidiferrobacterales bacterium]|nr:DUF975 family protein [Acidiferrobacterales bacterium]